MTPPSTSWTATYGIHDMAARLADWDLATQHSHAPSPYCGRPYGMAILQTYHQTDNPVLVCASQRAEIAGLLVLVERPLRRLGQTIHEIGFAFNPNTIVNDPLIDMPHETQAIDVAKALIEGAFSTGADSLLLDHMPADTGVINAFQLAAQHLGHPLDAPTKARDLYYTALVGDWAGYLATRSRNHRWQIKKSMRLAAEDASITVRHCTGRAALLAHLQDWFTVEQRSWQGASVETAMSDADRHFHRQLINDLPDRMLGELWLVYHADQPVAALRMLADNGQLSVHTMHFDAAFKALAPGAIAFHRMLQAACDAGLDEVDMHGKTAFFSRYATGQRPHQTLRIYRKGLRGAVLQKMRRAALAVQAFKSGSASGNRTGDTP